MRGIESKTIERPFEYKLKIRKGPREIRVMQVSVDYANKRRGIYSGRVLYENGETAINRWKANRISNNLKIYAVGRPNFHNIDEYDAVVENTIRRTIAQYRLRTG